MRQELPLAFIFFMMMIMTNCSSPEPENNSTNPMKQAEQMKDDGIGIGPVKEVKTTATIDEQLAAEGKKSFEGKCYTCHRYAAEKLIGPGLKGVTMRHSPEWIMNMILNPIEMTQKDSAAKALLAKYMSQMTNQNLSEHEARGVLEYFRKMDSNPVAGK